MGRHAHPTLRYPSAVARVPPKIGQHNEDILSAAGYSAEQIAELKASGVIGSESDRERDGAPPKWS